MSFLLDAVKSQLTEANFESLAQSIGADSTQTKSAVFSALPLLAGALSSQATANTGLSFLSSLLDKNHDGSVVDDVIGLVTGKASPTAVPPQSQAAVDSLLGEHAPAVAQQVANGSGLDVSAVSKLLPMLAPMLLGALTKAQVSQNLSAGGLSSFLEKEKVQIAEKAPEAHSLLTSLFDKNNDGNITDDVMKMGAGLLGNFLK